MKKLLKTFLLFIVTCLVGCAPQIGYKFTMTKPSDDSRLFYSDEYIDVKFALSETWYKGVEGMKQYDNFDGVAFVLTNKTSEVITIDWNKISFKDYTGSSGNTVMHKGIKYSECSSIKNLTIIPPKGQLNDIITPCYAVEFTGSEWKVHMLPSPRKMPTAEFGIYMSIKVDKTVHNYEFEFRATKDETED